jgi:PAB-dependent poly(A)-specific ribonuclease subunit 2
MSPDAIRELDNLDNTMSIPVSVMNALPINNSTEALYVNYDSLPGKGDIIAIDAEVRKATGGNGREGKISPLVLYSENLTLLRSSQFVSVQHEDSVISSDGGRVVLMEGRSSLARMSMLDCRSGVDLLLDDYVLPQEPVLDFLTRFSGIVPSDLDPQTSARHLVTMRTAYCKLRLLVDRGCIFVGHGLETDFHVLNVYVPPSQIVDTLVIYSQPKARKIGLRFLVNYFLGRDMQVDTHDSIEDAKAAYDLYFKAGELYGEGEEEFTRALNKVYEYGRSCDWKLGLGGMSTN